MCKTAFDLMDGFNGTEHVLKDPRLYRGGPPPAAILVGYPACAGVRFQIIGVLNAQCSSASKRSPWHVDERPIRGVT